jgi:hypothetical protein
VEPQQEFTDSERARLLEIEQEHEFQERLRKHRAKRWRRVRDVSGWFIAIVGGVGIVWDAVTKLAGWLTSHIK